MDPLTVNIYYGTIYVIPLWLKDWGYLCYKMIIRSIKHVSVLKGMFRWVRRRAYLRVAYYLKPNLV